MKNLYYKIKIKYRVKYNIFKLKFKYRKNRFCCGREIDKLEKQIDDIFDDYNQEKESRSKLLIKYQIEKNKAKCATDSLLDSIHSFEKTEDEYTNTIEKLLNKIQELKKKNE